MPSLVTLAGIEAAAMEALKPSPPTIGVCGDGSRVELLRNGGWAAAKG